MKTDDDTAPEFVPDAFERLRREQRKEQSATERILNWFCAEEDALDPLISPTRRCTRSKRVPLGDLPNHNNSSTLRASPLHSSDRAPSLKKRKESASSSGPQRRKVEVEEDSPGLLRARAHAPPTRMDNLKEDAVPLLDAAPKTPSPRKRGRPPKKGGAVEGQNAAAAAAAAISMGHDIKSPLSLSSLSLDPFVFSPPSQNFDIGPSPPRSPTRTITNTARTASTLTKKENLLYMTPPVTFLTINMVKDVGGLPEMTNRLWLDHVYPAISEIRVIPAYLEVGMNYLRTILC